MGWRQLRAYQSTMLELKHGPAPDPDSWDGADQDQGWDELRAKREQMRGR